MAAVFTLSQMIEVANAYMRENDIQHDTDFYEYHPRCAWIKFPLDNAAAVAGAELLCILQKSDYNKNYMLNEENKIYIQMGSDPLRQTEHIIFDSEKGLRLALLHLIPRKRMTPEFKSTIKRLISIEDKLDKLLTRNK